MKEPRVFSKKDFIQEIVDYIRKNLKKGYKKESLKWALIQQGYSKMEVEKAFDIYINVVLENAEEYSNGELLRKLGNVFVRGDTIVLISPQ